MDLLEVIKKEIRITEYAQLRGYTLRRAGAEYTFMEHDSVRIDPEKNLFIRNSTKTAGSIIDFVMWVDGLGQTEAIRKLRTMLRYGAEYTPRPPRAKAAPRKPLELPKPFAGRYNRVFAYLSQTRGIAQLVITAMLKRKMLYEDDHHNCVFVGYDAEGKAGYAAKRSTATNVSYRGDAPGSRKEIGFFVDNKAPVLFVTEAPIDAMSIMSMLLLNKRNPDHFNYLALGGVSDRALVYHISRPENRHIQRIYLATDNDAAGNLARRELRQSLERAGFKDQVIDKPPILKDWNDDLLQIRYPERERERQADIRPPKDEGPQQMKFGGIEQ